MFNVVIRVCGLIPPVMWLRRDATRRLHPPPPPPPVAGDAPPPPTLTNTFSGGNPALHAGKPGDRKDNAIKLPVMGKTCKKKEEMNEMLQWTQLQYQSGESERGFSQMNPSLPECFHHSIAVLCTASLGHPWQSSTQCPIAGHGSHRAGAARRTRHK